MGIMEDAIVAVTSDHGEEFLDHGGKTHGKTLYQEVVQVPLLMRWPGLPSREEVWILRWAYST